MPDPARIALDWAIRRLDGACSLLIAVEFAVIYGATIRSATGGLGIVGEIGSEMTASICFMVSS